MVKEFFMKWDKVFKIFFYIIGCRCLKFENLLFCVLYVNFKIIKGLSYGLVISYNLEILSY